MCVYKRKKGDKAVGKMKDQAIKDEWLLRRNRPSPKKAPPPPRASKPMPDLTGQEERLHAALDEMMDEVEAQREAEQLGGGDELEVDGEVVLEMHAI